VGSARLFTSNAAVIEQLEVKDAQIKDFALTSGIYKDTDSFGAACEGEFGEGSRVADFDTDLGGLTEKEIETLMDKLHIETSFNENNYFVVEEGHQYFGGARAYFFEKHDGTPPGNWLVHAQHGSIDLGSWFGISGQVLCVRNLAGGSAEKEADASVCGMISAKRVFDVQWSGNPSETVQHCSGFDAPYIPHKGRISVNRESDYFVLEKHADDVYSLKHFLQDGTLKNTLSGGKVMLASQEMTFYIIDNFYGTVITKTDHKDGDRADFVGLTSNPSPDVVAQCCQLPQDTVDCIPVCKAEGREKIRNCTVTAGVCRNKCQSRDLRCKAACLGTKTKCSGKATLGTTKCVARCIKKSTSDKLDSLKNKTG